VFRLMGCFVRVVALLVLAGLVMLAWFRGPELWRLVRGAEAGAGGGIEVVDEAFATEVMERFGQAVEGGDAEVSFSGQEVEAMLRYPLSGRLPRGSVEPTVRFDAGEALIGARFPRDSIPLPSELERGRGLLPERVRIQLVGTVLSSTSGPLLMVRRVEVAGLPVPHRIQEGILRHLRGERDAVLPKGALPLQLPRAVGEVYIDGDRLVLGSLP